MNEGQLAERKAKFPRYWPWLLAIMGAVFFLSVTSSDASAHGAGPDGGRHLIVRAESEPKWVANLPLWRFAGVPLNAFATLGEGVVRETRWGIYAFGNKSTGKVCLVLTDLYFGGSQRAISVHNEHGCRRQSILRRQPIFVHSGFAYQKRVQSPLVSADAIGLAVSAGVARVSFHFESGAERSVATRSLSSAQARKARVPRFRYVAFGVPDRVCVPELEGVGISGSAVFSAFPETCNEASDH